MSALAGCGGFGGLLAHPHVHQAGQLAVGGVRPLRLAEQALHRHRKLQRLSCTLITLQICRFWPTKLSDQKKG